MTIECICGHSIDVHLDNCGVPGCNCKKSMESIYDREIWMISNGYK